MVIQVSAERILVLDAGLCDNKLLQTASLKHCQQVSFAKVHHTAAVRLLSHSAASGVPLASSPLRYLQLLSRVQSAPWKAASLTAKLRGCLSFSERRCVTVCKRSLEIVYIARWSLFTYEALELAPFSYYRRS